MLTKLTPFKFFVSLAMLCHCADAQTDSRQVDDTRVTYLFGSILPKEAKWQPLTREQRWKIYLKSSWENPGVFFRAAGTAAIDHADNDPTEWNQGAAGYARRFGSRFGSFAIQDVIQASTAAAIGYDVRYLRCKCEGFFPRLGHAAKQNFVTKNREGHWRPNFPQWIGNFGSSAIAVYGWYPDSKRNGREIYQGAATQLAIPVVINSLVEFGPEIKRLFRRR